MIHRKMFFSHYKELEKIGLAAPEITYIMNDLKKEVLTLKPMHLQ